MQTTPTTDRQFDAMFAEDDRRMAADIATTMYHAGIEATSRAHAEELATPYAIEALGLTRGEPDPHYRVIARKVSHRWTKKGWR